MSFLTKRLQQIQIQTRKENEAVGHSAYNGLSNTSTSHTANGAEKSSHESSPEYVGECLSTTFTPNSTEDRHQNLFTPKNTDEIYQSPSLRNDAALNVALKKLDLNTSQGNIRKSDEYSQKSDRRFGTSSNSDSARSSSNFSDYQNCGRNTSYVSRNSDSAHSSSSYSDKQNHRRNKFDISSNSDSARFSSNVPDYRNHGRNMFDISNKSDSARSYSNFPDHQNHRKNGSSWKPKKIQYTPEEEDRLSELVKDTYSCDGTDAFLDFCFSKRAILCTPVSILYRRGSAGPDDVFSTPKWNVRRVSLFLSEFLLSSVYQRYFF